MKNTAPIPKTSGIYCVRNIANGKVYVGQAVNLHKRKREHFATLRAGKHHSRKLQNAWNKYGPDDFAFEVLELVLDFDLLMQAEQKWIDELKAYSEGYNIQPYACRGCFGMVIPLEVRAKTSATMKGRKYDPKRVAKSAEALRGRKLSDEHREKLRNRKATQETRAKISAANTGRHHTEESLKKMRAAQKGKVVPLDLRARISATLSGRKISPEVLAKRIGRRQTPEQIAKRAASLTGQKRSAESRTKMSLAQKGHEVRPETREKLSLANTGHHHTEETKAKFAARRWSPEHRAKISESGKRAWIARRAAA